MPVKPQSGNEGLVTAYDHHDEQVGNHHHVDQAQHHQHDLLLAELIGMAQQMVQFLQEQEDIDALRDDQAEIKRQLKPAQTENQHRQGAEIGRASCREKESKYVLISRVDV